MARTKEQILQAIVTARDQFLASIWGRDVRRGMGDIADAVYDAVVNQLLVLDETLTQNGSGADAAAVGNALNAINATISGDEDIIADLSLKTPSNFGVLPSGSVNLTNPPYALIGNAFFVLSSDNSYTDTPLNASFNGILLQLNYQNNSGKKIQLLAATNGKIFIRVYDTGAWGSWNGFDGDVSIDATLTVANAAADAKATGDALATKANISSLATVATTGNYNDLSNKPSIPTVDTTLTTQGAAADAKATGDALATKANISSLATVATSGSYNDLSNKPVLAAVATSGSYNDLSNKPSIPTVDTTLTTQGDAADAKATGDAISAARSEVMAAIATAMRNMGVLPNGGALGSIGSPVEPNQIYLLVSANSYTGVPAELTAPFNALLLHTSRWETVNNNVTCTLARQVLFAESGEVFIRCYDANALDEHGEPVGWTQWCKSAVPVDATLTTQGAAADAKATGDAISTARSEVMAAIPIIDTTLTIPGDAADARATGDALATKANISSLATVATSGSYNDLSDKPNIPAVDATLTAQGAAADAKATGDALVSVRLDISDLQADNTDVKSDISALQADISVLQTDVADGKSGISVLQSEFNALPTVAHSGLYDDLISKPDIPKVDATLTVSNAAADAASVGTLLSNKANSVDLALVATTGDYDDLNNKPIIDTTLTISGGSADAKATGDALALKVDVGDLDPVAFSGNYNDLSNKPSIPTVDATLTTQGAAADAKATGDALAAKANTSALSTVAFSGSYNDLSDKPNIPAVDTTLTISGAAADAKATGDAISTARSEVMAAIPMIDTTLSTQGDAADAKATGDAISAARSEVMAAIATAMRNMGALPNGGELGSIGSLGEPSQIYLLVSANSYTGVPAELTAPFNALLLHTSRWETVNNNETCTLARQVLFAESGEVFIRCYDANALDEHGAPVGWTQWRKSVVSVDATLTTQGAAADAKATGDLIQTVDTKATFAFNRGLTALGTLSNNSDFNNLVGKSHIYRLSQFRTYTNAPVNTGFDGWLIKTYYDDGQGTVEHGQIVFADSGEIYTRYNSGASWGSWATVANKTTIDATLSTSGAAADAAVVGTELAALKADYVVENGTSGSWTWRKWNSGILEMWGYHLSVRFDTTAAGEVNWRQAGSTGFSWASGSFNFPQTFYDKTYTMNISKEYDPDAQSSNLLIYGSVHQSTSQGGVRVLIPTDQTTGLNTTRLDVHVSGRWKA